MLNPNKFDPGQVLQKIVKQRRARLPELRQRLQQTSAERSRPIKDFTSVCRNQSPTFICEFKPASPSLGNLPNANKKVLMQKIYARHADAISVLVEPDFFRGDFDVLADFANSSQAPILCKDFVIDEVQIELAYRHGADAILLMLSVHDDTQYRLLYQAAQKRGMTVLTEIHDERELVRAINLPLDVLGINNRDLRTLHIDLAEGKRLAAQAVQELSDASVKVPVIAESGVRSRADVLQCASYADGFLIGSHLMSAENPERALKQLKFGDVKICGLTRQQDAQAAIEAGASHCGFVFASGSPRQFRAAADWVNRLDTIRVGVFANQTLSEISEKVHQYALEVVQLHGDETPSFIERVTVALPQVSIWKALPVDLNLHKNLPKYLSLVDKLLLDTSTKDGFGGSGRIFDWQLLADLCESRPELREKLIVAGGINPRNVSELLSLQPLFIDVSSGVESAPGMKCHKKIDALFSSIANGLPAIGVTSQSKKEQLEYSA